MGKAKKKKSQAPVALVYTITLLVFMAVFGYIAYELIKQMGSWKKEETASNVETDPSFNLLFARVEKTGALLDSAVVRFSPNEDKVFVVPVSAYTVSSSGGGTLAEVYETNGIRQLENAVEGTFGIKVDAYITVSKTSFETVCDIIGGIVYTPQEDLYKLSANDADDISYQGGKAVDLSGHMVARILEEKVFSDGWKGNNTFLGNVLEQLVNNAFQQSNFTKNSLENIYSQLTSGGDTNYTKNEFTDNKTYINEMLDNRLNKPAVLMVPDGTWTDEVHFSPASTFVNDLKEVFSRRVTKSGGASFGTSSDSDDTASAAETTMATAKAIAE